MTAIYQLEFIMRINKYIAECGVTSRRNADSLIKEGRVKLNGKTVSSLGIEVNEENDSVFIDGKKISLPSKYTYILFNKPKGCVTTVKDDKDRKTVFDFINVDKRLFPVGRLDYDSEGMLILTNDGELSFRLTHPSNEIPKTYSVKIEGTISEQEIAKLRGTVTLPDGSISHHAKIKRIEEKDGNTKLQVTIYEGKNRQIRKMFESVDKNVIFLKRTAIGDFKLGGVSRGSWRYLTEEEVYYLQNI